MRCFPLNNKVVEVVSVSGRMAVFGRVDDRRLLNPTASNPFKSGGASRQSKVAGTDALLRKSRVRQSYAERCGHLQ